MSISVVCICLIIGRQPNLNFLSIVGMVGCYFNAGIPAESNSRLKALLSMPTNTGVKIPTIKQQNVCKLYKINIKPRLKYNIQQDADILFFSYFGNLRIHIE